jgi:hypothetical protein
MGLEMDDCKPTVGAGGYVVGAAIIWMVIGAFALGWFAHGWLS